MPNLEQVLSQTLLRLGAGGTRSSRHANSYRGVYWSFKQSEGDLDEIGDLRCSQPKAASGHPAADALVCRSISWSAPSVTIAASRGQPTTVSLPLKREYLLAQEHRKGGNSASNSSTAWPLAYDFDVGFQCIFGYEWDSAGRKLRPLSPAVLQDDDFWPLPRALAKLVTLAERLGLTQRVNDYTVDPLRLLVCISLVCCKPKADFTPGEGAANPVKAARFFPHMSISVNREAAFVHYDAKIEMMRPANANHACHMDPDEQMSDKIGASGYTDTNFERQGLVPTVLPIWENIFDWYTPDLVANQEFVAVYPSTAKSRVKLGLDDSGMRWSDEKRTYHKCVQALTESDGWSWEDKSDAEYYSDRGVRKMWGQGEYDNIHLAPKMISLDGVKRYPGWGFDRIVMAPFCVHDCLHVHWRWGAGLPMLQPWNDGWTNTTAYAKRGAPMVPPHQQVWITPIADSGETSPHGLRYRVRGNEVRVGEWDVVFSHGAAYSYELTFAGGFASGGSAFSQTMVLRPTWANLYWLLRHKERGYNSRRRPLDGLRFADLASGARVRKG